MIHLNASLLVLSILNAISFIIIGWVIVKLPKSQSKTAFLGLCLAFMCWVNSLMLVQNKMFSMSTASILSRLVFVSGAMVCMAFSHFAIVFSDPKKIKSLVHWLVQSNMVIVFLLIISGQVENGVAESGEKIIPVFGPFYQYNSISIIATNLYSLYILVSSYRNAINEMMKYQVQAILMTSMATFIGIIVTNISLPMLFKQPDYAMSGGLWVIFLFTGMSNILVNGKSYYVKKAFSKLLKSPSFEDGTNIQVMREVVDWLGTVVNKGVERSEKNIDFRGKNDEKISIQLSKNNENLSEQSEGIVHIKHISGLFDQFYRLQDDNRRMAFALMRAEKLLQESSPGSEVLPVILQQNANLLELKEYHSVHYSENLESNILENRSVYGQDIMCYSPSYFEVLMTVKQYALSRELIIFEGQPGVGKKMLSKAMHHLRNGKSIFYLMQMEDDHMGLLEFLKKIQYKENSDFDGLLIELTSAIDEKILRAIKMISELCEPKFVYVTTVMPIGQMISKCDESIQRFYANQLRISVPELSKRREDIFYQIMHFAHQAGVQKGLKNIRITNKFMESAKQYYWAGNTTELKLFVKKLVYENAKGELNNFPESAPRYLPDQDANPGQFSKLEVEEKKVIENMLRNFNYNKSKTKNELKITVNTLNAKIKKYNIQIPK